MASSNIASGRRGVTRYLYGTHYWIPEVQADWSRGMVRDTARVAIPPGSVYNSSDYLLHRPGVAMKRGGWTYAAPAMTGSSKAVAAVYADFPAGAQLLSIGKGVGAADNHLYLNTSGATTDKGQILNQPGTIDKPKLRVGGTPLLIITASDGTTGPSKYDGSAAPSALGGTPPAGKFSAIYKSRVALAGSTAQPQRIYFSPTPDIASTWDTANSWLDASNAVTGLAALNNVLLVFSNSHMERIIGSTPPPNTDMDLAPVATVGCTDARSITVTDGNCYFASPTGVYVTNGTAPISLTKAGGIETYWQDFFTSSLNGQNYNTTDWTITTEVVGSFLYVSVVQLAFSFIINLMCYLPTRAWWTINNMAPVMYAAAAGVKPELYIADYFDNRVIALSSFFNPTATVKNDGDGAAVTPTIEFAPNGQGPGVKSFGFGHLDFDMRDSATDNPTMAVTIKAGIEADTTATPAESPLGETTTLTRPRFSICREAQAVTVALAQTNASSKTELYSLEVETRSQSLVGEGVS